MVRVAVDDEAVGQHVVAVEAEVEGVGARVELDVEALRTLVVLVDQNAGLRIGECRPVADQRVVDPQRAERNVHRRVGGLEAVEDEAARRRQVQVHVVRAAAAVAGDGTRDRRAAAIDVGIDGGAGQVQPGAGVDAADIDAAAAGDRNVAGAADAGEIHAAAGRGHRHRLVGIGAGAGTGDRVAGNGAGGGEQHAVGGRDVVDVHRPLHRQVGDAARGGLEVEQLQVQRLVADAERRPHGQLGRRRRVGLDVDVIGTQRVTGEDAAGGAGDADGALGRVAGVDAGDDASPTVVMSMVPTSTVSLAPSAMVSVPASTAAPSTVACTSAFSVMVMAPPATSWIAPGPVTAPSIEHIGVGRQLDGVAGRDRADVEAAVEQAGRTVEIDAAQSRRRRGRRGDDAAGRVDADVERIGEAADGAVEGVEGERFAGQDLELRVVEVVDDRAGRLDGGVVRRVERRATAYSGHSMNILPRKVAANDSGRGYRRRSDQRGVGRPRGRSPETRPRASVLPGWE